jgi:hypothetical protein
MYANSVNAYVCVLVKKRARQVSACVFSHAFFTHTFTLTFTKHTFFAQTHIHTFRTNTNTFHAHTPSHSLSLTRAFSDANMDFQQHSIPSGNTKGRSITVLFTSCLTGQESAVWLLTIFVFICETDYSKPVKQEVNSTVILSPLVFPDSVHFLKNS